MIRSRKSKSTPEINTTSLPDIIFMLLFFFMVVTVLRKDDQPIELQLPSVSYAELIRDKDQVAISLEMTKNGMLYCLGKERYKDIKNFEKGLLSKGPELKRVRIKLVADKSVKVSEVNTVKSTLQRCELYNVEYLVNKVSG